MAAQLGAAEERLRTLFETMPPGVVHYAADGSVLGANPAARRILGLSASEMTSWPLRTIRRAIHEDGTEIARRLAIGLANADTFAREHAIAETLQRAILPDVLPQIPGLDLAVRYLPLPKA